MHLLSATVRFGDLKQCTLRPGNVHSADDWENTLKPVVARYKGKVSRIYFHANAASAISMPTSTSKPRGSSTRSACPPTAFCRSGSANAGASGRPPAE